jgi:cytochrome c556
MIFRTTVVAIAVVLGAYAAMAQVDAIKTRKSIMKGVGDQTKIGGGMAKGEVPYDQAKVQAIFNSYIDASEKMPNLFPDNSKTGEETAALPSIWENMADFKARFAKLGADAKAALTTVTDLATFRSTFTEITKNCGGCHEKYRAKKS